MDRLLFVFFILFFSLQSWAITGPSTDSDGSYTLHFSPRNSYKIEEFKNGVLNETFYSPSHGTLSISGRNNGSYRYDYWTRVTLCGLEECEHHDILFGSHTVVVDIPNIPPPMTPPSLGSAHVINRVYLSWAASTGLNVTQYEVQRSSGGAWSTVYLGAQLSFRDSVSVDGIYNYRVRAKNAQGWSAFSANAQTTVAITPGVPASITVPATSDNGVYNVVWEKSIGTVDRYELFQQANDSSLWSPVYTGLKTVGNVSGLADGHYTYHVRACNDESTLTACSTYRTSSITTVANTPGKPSQIQVPVSDNTGEFSVSWSVVDDALDRYELYQQANGGKWNWVYSGAETSKTIAGLSTGSYIFRVRACNVQGDFTSCGHYKTSSLVSVYINEPGGNAIDPATDPTPEPMYNGLLKGDYFVDKSGALNYHLPITIAPGINGMQPDLSLNYHSNKKNGLVGWGWSIGGLSSITRCAATVARDNAFSGINTGDNYRFCLDGKRLVEVANGEYRTESDEFSRITRVGGIATAPAFWTVEHNNGETLTYGSTSDAVRLDNQSQPLTWYINRRQDIAGNYLTYLYTNDIAQDIHRIQFINYTHNDQVTGTNNEILFEYENRDDVINTYRAGRRHYINQRLKSIETRAANANLNTYTLTYQEYGQTYFGKVYEDPLKTSHLAQIDVCYAQDAQCVKPLRFEWNDSESSTFGVDFAATNNPPPNRSGDFDGDGLFELYSISHFPVSAPDFTIHVKSMDPREGESNFVTGRFNNNLYPKPTAVYDMNLDGKTDLVGFYQKDYPSYQYKVVVYRSTGNEFIPETWADATTELDPGWLGFAKKFLQDVNNDQLPDLNYYRINHQDPASSKWYVKLNTGSGFGPIQIWLDNLTDYFPQLGAKPKYGDFNGDGLIDILVCRFAHVNNVRCDLEVLINTGQSFRSKGLWGRHGSDSYSNLAVADVNGDGLSDVIHHSPLNNTAVYVNLSTGNRFTTWQLWHEDSMHMSKRFTHMNDDKCADMVSYERKRELYDVWVALSSCAGTNEGGQGFLPARWITDYRSVSQAERPDLFDSNFDGLFDLSMFNSETSERTVNTTTKKHMLSIVDSLGGKVAIHYGPITTSTHYTVTDPTTRTFSFISSGESYDGEGDEDTKKKMITPMPRFVVETLTEINPAGDIKHLSYHYKNHKLDYSGWGSLGFSDVEVIKTDTAGNIRKTVNQYHQIVDNHFALIGYPVLTRTYVSDTYQPGNVLRLLTSERFQWKVRVYSDDIDATHNSPHYFPYIRASNVQSWDLIGTKGSQSIKNYSTDLFSCSPATTLVITTAAGSSSDNDFSAYGVPLFSRHVLCDTVDGQSLISATDTTNSNIFAVETPTQWVQGLVQRQSITGWRGNPGSLASQVRTTAYGYNEQGQLTEQTTEPDEDESSPLQLKTRYSYNNYGTVSRTMQSWGEHAGTGLAFSSTTALTDESYGADGVRTVTITDAAGLIQTTRYSSKFGLPFQVTDVNNLTTTTFYDNLGRIDFIVHPDGTATEKEFRECINCFDYNNTAAFYIQEKSTGYSATRMYLDALGREVGSRARTLNGDFVYTRNKYDSRGNRVSSTAPFLMTPTINTFFEYDVIDRLRKTRFADGSIETIDYNGMFHTTTNRLGQTNIQQLTEESLVILSRDANGSDVTYTYSPFGDLKTTILAANPATTINIHYDRLGRKTQLIDPNMGTRTYTYNALGLLASETDSKGQMTQYHYDKLGRLVKRIDDALTAGAATRTHHWTYDNQPNGKGLPGSITGYNTDGTAYSEQYEYTALSLLETTDTVIDNKRFKFKQHYNSFSRPAGITYPSGYSIIEDYNDYGFLHTIRSGSDGRALWMANNTNAYNDLTQFTLGNGVVTDQTFDDVTRHLQSIHAYKDTFTIQDHTYRFDALGNLVKRVDNKHTVTQHFCYDILNRLKATREQICSATDDDYTYDALGNIIGKLGVPGTYSYGQHSAGPHAITTANNLTYQYDTNGNLTSAMADQQMVKTVTYTAFNKPVRINDSTTGSEKWSEFIYGPTKNRVKQTNDAGTTTVYASLGSYEEITENDIIRQIHYLGDFALYISGSEGIDKGEYRYQHRDHLGSLVAKSGQQADSANDVQWLSNGPWGERRKEAWNGAKEGQEYPLTDSARGFTGHEHLDGVGLIHMNGRVYDPTLGRFLSPDPYVTNPDNSQGFNRYSYVLNNPLSYTDPSGYDPVPTGYCDDGCTRATNPWSNSGRGLGLLGISTIGFSGVASSLSDTFANNLLAQMFSEAGLAGVFITLDMMGIEGVNGPLTDRIEGAGEQTETDKQQDTKEKNKEKRGDALGATASPNGEDPNNGDKNNNDGDKQKKGTPGNNQAQNKQFKDATRGLNKAQKRKVHDEISGQNMSFEEIKEIADEVRKGLL